MPMKYYFLLPLLILTGSCMAQYEFVKQALEKNLIFYNLVHNSQVNYMYDFDENGNATHSLVYSGWQNEIPDECYRIELSIVPTDLVFPDTAFELVGVSRPAVWTFHNYVTDKTLITSWDDGYEPRFDTKYLIGYKKNQHTYMIFISGHVFKDSIWWYFRNGGYSTDNLINFIRIKCFNMDIDTIEFKYRKGRKYYFAVRVKDQPQKDYTIIFNPKNPDLLILKHQKQIEKI